jgi:hypothetical protein
MELLKTVAVAAAIGLGIAAAAPAGASVVNMTAKESPYMVEGSFTGSSDYVGAWSGLSDSYTPGYHAQSFTNWDGQHNSGIPGGADTNLAYHDEVGFDVTQADAGSWTFQLGIDFGLGGTFLIDGTPVDTNTNNLWWAGNINDANNTLYATVNLAPGYHVLNVYGFEDCCDGGTLGQYLAPGAQSFSTDFGVLAAPEPASWALMLIGFGGMGAALRSRRRAAAAA